MAKTSDVPGLKEAIKRAGMTQKSLAEKLEVSEITLSRWIQGTQDPPAGKIRQAAEITGADIRLILGIEIKELVRGEFEIIDSYVNSNGKREMTLKITER